MSLDARSLFDAAREDAPDADVRDALWARVSGATGAGAGAGAASHVGASKAGTAATGAAGGKLLAIGGAIGAVCTALGAVLAIGLAGQTSAPSTRDARGRHAQRSVARGARLAEPDARRRDPATLDRAAPAPDEGADDTETGADRAAPTGSASSAAASSRSSAAGRAPGPRARARATDSTGDLAEEARLLTEARAALVRGDAARALTLVQGTRRLSTRALEPEELGLEARALRALGRADDAAATELVLRRRYPSHALAR
jgi:hypothetical protein